MVSVALVVAEAGGGGRVAVGALVVVLVGSTLQLQSCNQSTNIRSTRKQVLCTDCPQVPECNLDQADGYTTGRSFHKTRSNCKSRCRVLCIDPLVLFPRGMDY